MNISEKLVTIAENIPKVYKSGQVSMVDETKIIKKTVSGESVMLDDVSEIPHKIEVKLSSGGKNLWEHGDVNDFTESSGGKKVKLLSGITYTFSALVTSTDVERTTCLVYDTTNAVFLGQINRDVRSSITFTPTKQVNEIRLYASDRQATSVGDTATFKDIMLEQISGENLFDINDTTIEKKRRLSANAGTSWSNSADGSDNFNVSHYIPVESGKKYTLYNSYTGQSWYCWYDKDKVYISGGGTTAGKILTAPSNACYIRFDYPATDTNVTFCELFEPSEYEPYKETLTDYSGVSLTRCGNSLIPYPYHDRDNRTVNGITWTVNEDKTITANGTATTQSTFYLHARWGHTFMLHSGTYYFKCSPVGANSSTYYSSLEYSDQSGATKYVNDLKENGLTFTTDISSFYTVVLIVKAGVTVNNLVFKPMLNFGTTPLPYEPYNAQTLTANSDGTVEGVKSTSPYMYMTTDNANCTINAEYHKSYGMNEAVKRFWDIYINTANGNYGYKFAGGSWTHELLDTIPYPLYIYNAPGMFYYNNAVTDLSNFPLKDGVFSITNFDGVFREAVNLKKTFLIDATKTTSGDGAFLNCKSLESVYFVENTIGISFSFSSSPLLNKESILNIIAGLSTTATGKTLTLSTTAVTNAFGSTTATEWTNLVATKTNWTISLV